MPTSKLNKRKLVRKKQWNPIIIEKVILFTRNHLTYWSVKRDLLSDRQGHSLEFFGRWLKVFNNVGHNGWLTRKVWGCGTT